MRYGKNSRAAELREWFIDDGYYRGKIFGHSVFLDGTTYEIPKDDIQYVTTFSDGVLIGLRSTLSKIWCLNADRL